MTFAPSAFGEDYPAFSFSKKSEGSPDIKVSVVLVPEADEPAFLSKLIANSREGGDPLLVIYRDGGSQSAQLDAETRDSKQVLFHRLPGQRDPAAVMSEESVRRAGVWVAITATGVFSVMFYKTCDAGPATAAMVLAFLLQGLQNVGHDYFLGYLNGGSKVSNFLIGRITPPSASDFVGSASAGILFNMVTTSAFQLALDGGPSAIGNTLSTAFSGWFSNNTWDSAFKIMKGEDGEQNKKAVMLMNYAKQLTFAAIGPFAFLPQTHDKAVYVGIGVGAIGLTGSFFHQHYLNAANTVIARIENSQRLDSWFAKILNFKAGVQNVFKPRKPLCIAEIDPDEPN